MLALKAAIQKEMYEALEETAEDSYQDLKTNANHYYDSPEDRYKRTGQLRDSPQLDGMNFSGDTTDGQISINTETQYLEEFQERHKVKCFDNEGEQLSNSTILDNVLTGERLWDGLSEKEKKEFVEKLRMTSDDMVRVINVWASYVKENSRLQQNRLRMLDESEKLMDRYKEVQEKYQYISKVYEVFFNDLKISDFLNAI